MDVSAGQEQQPLGLNLDFLFGRGYLWTKSERLSDWITLESLRMEIPDLQFPFDVRGGLHRFRNTRCLVREIEFVISEAGLSDLLHRAAASLDGFHDLRLRFLDDAVHVALRLSALGAQTSISFRLALIPPEPARADEMHLSLYDFRSFGPLPYPARLMASELMRALLQTSTLKPPGRGSSFSVSQSGDLLRFRPLKLLLLHIFPRVGWKLPDLSDIVLEGARIRPGAVSIRASSRDESWRRTSSPSYQLAATPAGARAIAAYEAKELFAPVDRALFEGQVDEALRLLSSYRAAYGLHVELVDRMLDCLLAEGTPTAVAEATTLCQELERENPTDLRSMLARPNIALLAGQRGLAMDLFDALAGRLRERHEMEDWVLAELAAVHLQRDEKPEDAAGRLREILRVYPRHRQALEQLGELYARLGDAEGQEEILKRLTGVYTERHRLKETYLSLARHLMDRRGQLQEARVYLEKALRLAPTELDALHALGESYVLSEEPLRALKAFGSAARAAEREGLLEQAAELHMRVSRLWGGTLSNPSEALLSVRRALELAQPAVTVGNGREGGEQDSRTQRRHPQQMAQEMFDQAARLEFAAELSERLDRWDEAVRYLTDALPVLERLWDLIPILKPLETTEWRKPGWQLMPGQREEEERSEEREQARRSMAQLARVRLLEVHESLGRLYVDRGRQDAASTHWRRIVELGPTRTILERLEHYYREHGRPEQLIELYQALLDQPPQEDEERLYLHLRLAEVYEALYLVEDAREQLQEALQIDPSARDARDRLVRLLVEAQRYETLRDALNSLLVRSRDREERFSLLTTLGRLYAGPLEHPRNAARSFHDALQLDPTSLEALRGACEAMLVYGELQGHGSEAPAGVGTVGEVSQQLLLRLVDKSDDPQERVGALRELYALARIRGDEATAREARRRAGGLLQAVYHAPQDEDLDERLDALLGPQRPPQEEKATSTAEFFSGTPTLSGPVDLPGDEEETRSGNTPRYGTPRPDDLLDADQGVEAEERFGESLEEEEGIEAWIDSLDEIPEFERRATRADMSATPLAVPESSKGDDGGEEELEMPPLEEHPDMDAGSLGSFRERLQDMWRLPGRPPKPGSLGEGSSPLGRLLQRSREDLSIPQVPSRGQQGFESLDELGDEDTAVPGSPAVDLGDDLSFSDFERIEEPQGLGESGGTDPWVNELSGSMLGIGDGVEEDSEPSQSGEPSEADSWMETGEELEQFSKDFDKVPTKVASLADAATVFEDDAAAAAAAVDLADGGAEDGVEEADPDGAEQGEAELDVDSQPGDDQDEEGIARPEEESSQGDDASAGASSEPQEGAAPVDEGLSWSARIEEARGEDNPALLVEVLLSALDAHEDPADGTELRDDQYNRFVRQAAELLYYDLDAVEDALPLMEIARARDPEGFAASRSLLNALERIYEDQGALEARIELLQMRLEAAESHQMETTYRLLLGQLLWEARRDRAAVEAVFAPVLERDSRHEAVHRFMVEVCESSEDWESAVDHLRVVLSEGSGGLDELEMERRLAEILLYHLDRPEEAAEHFERLMSEAPGDSKALEGLKQAAGALEDWDAFMVALARELSLLLGRLPAPRRVGPARALFEGLVVEEVSPSLCVAASQITSDAASLAEDQLEDIALARRLWGKAFALWPEAVEALERRLALDRKEEASEDLAQDLQSMASLLLEPQARFAALAEAAAIYAGELEDREQARQLYAEAIALVEDAEPAPAGLDEARRALQALQSEES